MSIKYWKKGRLSVLRLLGTETGRLPEVEKFCRR
jgi:hypothetical protein